MGTYLIKVDGTVVASVKNTITTGGKKVMAGYLAGIIPSWAGSVAVGVGNSAAAVGDTYLDFEVDRVPVSSRSVAYGAGAGGAHRIFVKGSLPETLECTIYELGIFSAATDSSVDSSTSLLISTAESAEDWEEYDGADWIDISTTPDESNRLGGDAITLSVGATSKKFRLTGLSLDLSDSKATDKFIFLTKLMSGTLSSVTIRIKTDESNYVSYSPSVASFVTGTYAAVEFNRSLWTATGTPDWSNINTVEIEIASGSSGAIIVDGVRLQEARTIDSDDQLFSRAVLPVPIVKNSGSQMEIEYYLDA
jgi:hypothetical protein